ncbi:AMP-binding enzyme [Actinoplanes teichomyceticus]|uniref:AMP-binding enzyme n=1 Tax=Actinoplanes teichomyceticus TaxID=1867 RepID=A0A561VLF1_ACTTI|nr:AMP-binding enzyme [Actinoplanes teichomyceticus]GIF13784.1 hypothetical protein Ate01nite_38160 [Actinoplanes teichomyceticus]
MAYNCVDRHVGNGNGDRVAFHFVGEPGDERTITYQQLFEQVCRAANALQEFGVGAGDTVAIYLPMIPEAVVAMLACARIGAPHTVVFGGFSADALRSRIVDFDAKVGSPRTAVTGAARPRRSSRPSTTRWRSAPECGRSWWCAGPGSRSAGPRAVTCGGMR